jgi:excinuclease ABC subunit B
VSLVAILDADKEGFLRSERSLIQTIGRAARNLNGRAILYADRMTGSMERAIAESEKRRTIQLEFNLQNGITPVGVDKKVNDVMEGAYGGAGESRVSKRGRAVADTRPFYNSNPGVVDAKSLSKEIGRLEARMYELAKNLEFEEAARSRDQIAALKARLLQG